MIKLEYTTVYGWNEAIRGMRNPMNSWDRSDSEYKRWCLSLGPDEEPHYCNDCHFDQCMMSEPEFVIGENDHDLMRRLCNGGPVHAKFRRMITVYVDITAPLYWWKEFDTYKVGTTANSCSTMHKVHAKEFTIDDFSHEHLDSWSLSILENLIRWMNENRTEFIKTKNKDAWWQMIQLLPTSYNQKRTVELNYEVLNNIYHSRLNHKLDEWHDVCRWIESLPYSWIITGKEPNNG